MKDASNVLRFAKRKKELNRPAGLAHLGEIAQSHPDGIVEADSITHLGTLLEWEQSRISKAVKAWKEAGQITVDHAANGKLHIRVMPSRASKERDSRPSQGAAMPKTKRAARRPANKAAEHAETHAFGHAEEHAADHAKSENADDKSIGKPLEVDPTGAQKMPLKEPAAGMPVGMSSSIGRGMFSSMPKGMPSAPETARANHVTRHAPGPGSWQLILVAYGFFGLGIAINIWNARTTGGDLLSMAILVGQGVLVEAVLFYVPARLLTLKSWLKPVAIGVFTLFFMFAVVNSLRMASLIAADQTAARADRQTAGMQAAALAVEHARAQRDQACRKGQASSDACRSAKDDVAKLEKTQTAAAAKVEGAAKPENADFSALVTWLTRGTIKPGATDFSMIWLLLRTILPQIGGLVLLLAKR
jgi:hypothetical protein